MLKKRNPSLANHPLCRIAAVGASAGGLRALIAFLKSLPPNIPMAFVLIQHLEPQHKSALAEILSRETPLNICEAKNGAKIKSSHVYVIPPNTLMAVSRGRLKITSRGKRADGRYLPVDFFMTSLAGDQREKAIGIVLSGTGSDGTLGLKAIKAKGGMTFAQDQKTAQYDGMPGSAIASGAVDFTLEPGEIAKKLVRIAAQKHPRPSKQAENLLTAENGLTMILVLLRELTGVDFLHYKQATISRRIARRMCLHHIKGYADYYNYLKINPAEADVLRKDILIPVTSFFRDPEIFAALRKKAFPLMLKKRSPKNPIRLWVPACSTGEEVYSMAISLYEFMVEKKMKPHIQIFGTDLSEALIEKARAGAYAEDISAAVSAERLGQFFVKTEKGYKIAKPIRDLCIFARHDITNDPPLSGMDMASCRNLLIYLDTFLQNKALSMLHYALKPKGFLVLGSAESAVATPGFFTAVDKKRKIYSKNPVARPHRPDTMTPQAARRPAPAEGRRTDKKIRARPGTDYQIILARPKKARIEMRDIPKAAGAGKPRRENAKKDIARLRKEFARTVERLNAVSEEKDAFNEELKAANEEIQSSNEELQSMNEELETSKEELQSTNEELVTLNEELQNKNEELTQLNNDLSNVFSSAGIPMIIVGNDLRIKRFTPMARKVMSLIPADVERPLGDIKLNIHIENLEEMILSVIEDMTVKESEVKDKEGRWYAMRIRPYRTLDNKIDGAVISLIDIDAIKCAREELQGALDYAQAIIETMREPLLVLDEDARVLSANKAFYHTFVVRSSDVENKLLYELGGHQWADPKLRKALQEILPKKTFFNDLEVSFDFPLIGQKTMLLNGRQIKMRGRDQKMILLMIEDITKRKKAEEVLRRDNETLEKMVEERSGELIDLQIRLERTRYLSDIGTLAATIAHELRNTLAAINVAAYNIRKKMKAPPGKSPLVEVNLSNIDKAVLEGDQIINNVLSYSKIKVSYFEIIKINDILKSCIHDIRNEALNQGVTIHEDTGLTEGVLIDAAPTQIKEVFSNILKNALDAVNRNAGVIKVETKIKNSRVSALVRDNGVGIPRKDLGKVLDPFFTTKAKGTGLGLAVCNQIVMLHDGAIAIESDEGKGTAVQVTLLMHRKEK